jgi:hypothetical protein
MTETIHKEGFLLVASMHSHYKNSAIQCIESLEDYYDDPKVVVACHPEWVEDFERLDSVIKVVSDDFPISTRSKLWALQHTVFEKTCYLDADMEVVDEEIGRVFNLLDDDHDCAFTVIDPHTGSSTAIYAEDGERDIRDNNKEKHLRYHGGFFLWWNNDKHPNAAKAINEWWPQYLKINCNPKFWDEHPEIYFKNKAWDQFTWWWIHTNIVPDLKIQEVEDNNKFDMVRWNWNHYMDERSHGNLSPIIKHHPINRSLMRQTEGLYKEDEYIPGMGPGGNPL